MHSYDFLDTFDTETDRPLLSLQCDHVPPRRNADLAAGFRSMILHLIVVLTELRDKVTPACPLHTALQALPTTDARYTDVLAMLRRCMPSSCEPATPSHRRTRRRGSPPRGVCGLGNRTRRRRIARAAHGGARAAVRLLAAPCTLGLACIVPIAGHGRRVGRGVALSKAPGPPPRRRPRRAPTARRDWTTRTIRTTPCQRITTSWAWATTRMHTTSSLRPRATQPARERTTAARPPGRQVVECRVSIAHDNSRLDTV